MASSLVRSTAVFVVLSVSVHQTAYALAPLSYAYTGPALGSVSTGIHLSPSDTVSGIVTFTTEPLPNEVDKSDLAAYSFSAGPVSIITGEGLDTLVFSFDASLSVVGWTVQITDIASPTMPDGTDFISTTDSGGTVAAIADSSAVLVDIGVNTAEAGQWTAVVPGDGNGDGKVDGLDYIIWASNFGDDPADDPPGSPANGDFNDDDVVNGLDYVQWAINFGQGPNDGVAVPEPTTALMLLLGWGIVVVGRRRR